MQRREAKLRVKIFCNHVLTRSFASCINLSYDQHSRNPSNKRKDGSFNNFFILPHFGPFVHWLYLLL